MSTGSTSSETTPTIPDELKPLMDSAAQQTIALQQALPLVESFAEYNPRQISALSELTEFGLEQTPALSAVQPGILGAMYSIATIPELAAQPVEDPHAESVQYDLLSSLVGGPIGSSPATIAGMEAWEEAVLPTVQNEAVQMGLGRSGPALEAMSDSATQAYVPLVQQEINNRANAVNQLQAMGEAETTRELVPRTETQEALKFGATESRQLADLTFNQQLMAIEEAFRAGEITESKQQELFDAAYDEFLRLQALAESATLGPLGIMIPSAIGTQSSGKSSSVDMGSAMSGLMSGAGMIMSDERLKTDIGDVSDEAGMEAIRETPIHTWKYKGDTEEHMGPMAQDAHRSGLSRPATVNGYGALEFGDMMGKLLSAARNLDKRLAAMERR